MELPLQDRSPPSQAGPRVQGGLGDQACLESQAQRSTPSRAEPGWHAGGVA